MGRDVLTIGFVAISAVTGMMSASCSIVSYQTRAT